MQNNYYFLKKLTTRLKDEIIGWSLTECYSQNKNEIIFGFTSSSGEGEFFIRAMLRPDFSCLSFPENLHRAKRNSVDLFSPILDRMVSEIIMFKNERAFLLKFNDAHSLLFKMHGNRSNLILLEDDVPVDLFNNRLPRDRKIEINSLDRPVDQSFEAFSDSGGRFEILFPTFGKEVKKHFADQSYDSLSLEQKWKLIQDVLQQLEDDRYYIKKGNLPSFTLLQSPTSSEFHDPLIAVSSFYVQWLSAKKFYSEKSAVIKKLSSEIKKDESYISVTKEKLRKTESENNYRQWADLLMANMHRIKQGGKEAIVENFYINNDSISIPLNEQLSPQKNAERYYQKAKNQHKEIAIYREGINKREERLLSRMELLEKLENVKDIKELKEIMPEEISKTANKSSPLPYFHFTIEGFDVLVGKSARHNDIILQKYSRKDDLWLHARDVSGSHVIIKTGNNPIVPQSVIEKAAKLAAWNSKRKTDSLCPVIFTPRKYVRKRKGDPPGAVVVDREEVIMVEPSMDI